MGLQNTLAELGRPAEYLSQWVDEMKANRQAEEEKKFMGFVYNLMRAKVAPDYNPSIDDVIGMAHQAGIDPNKRPDLIQKGLEEVKRGTEYVQGQLKWRQAQDAQKDIRKLQGKIMGADDPKERTKLIGNLALLQGDARGAVEAEKTLNEMGKPQIYKANPTRTVKRGDKEITEEMNPSTGAWSQIGEAPRWQDKNDEGIKLDPFQKKDLDSLYTQRDKLTDTLRELESDPAYGSDPELKDRADNIRLKRRGLNDSIESMRGGATGQSSPSTGAPKATGEVYPPEEASLRLNLRRAAIAMNAGDEKKAAALSENADKIQEKMGLSPEEFKRIADEEVERAGSGKASEGVVKPSAKATGKATEADKKIDQVLAKYPNKEQPPLQSSHKQPQQAVVKKQPSSKSIESLKANYQSFKLASNGDIYGVRQDGQPVRIMQKPSGSNLGLGIKNPLRPSATEYRGGHELVASEDAKRYQELLTQLGLAKQ